MILNNFPLWTALVTPFDDNNKVHWPDFKKLIEEQDNAGNGLLILGSTGEALNLDLETKKEIVLFAKRLKPKNPIMIGVGGHQLEETKSWMGFLEEVGVDAYLLVTPIYSKPGTEGQYLWFKTLMDLSSKPVMLYNVPSRAGTALSLEAVRRLSSHPKFWSIKEASGSVEKFKEYYQACNQGKVFSGDDAMTYDFCKAGGCGLVSVASNVWPTETNLYVKKCLEQNLPEKDLWISCSNNLFTYGNPVTPKKLMFDLKKISTPNVLMPLSSADAKNMEVQHQSHQLIQNWFQKNK